MTGIYKHIDEHGNVSYSDSPPVASGGRPARGSVVTPNTVGRIHTLQRRYPHLRADQVREMIEREREADARRQRDAEEAEQKRIAAIEAQERELAEAQAQIEDLDIVGVAKEILLPQDAADVVLMAGGGVGKLPKAGKVLAKVLDKKKAIEAIRKKRKALQAQIDAARADKAGKVERGAVVEKKVLSLKTKPDEAYFWSGLGRGGDKVAAEIAATRGGTTLEQVIKSRGMDLPVWDAANPSSVQAWQNASRAYAEGASGNVRAVLGDTMRPGNIWETIELPALKANPNVSQIIRVHPSTGVETVIFTR